MTTSNPDPLFWPLLFFTVLACVFVAGVVVVVKVLVRRDPDPRDQRQHAGDRGSNTYDASSHSTTTFNVRDLNIGNPRSPGSLD